MKKLNKIKLTVLNSNEIADREQRMLIGGGDYKCGCVSYCLDDYCACFDEGGSMAKDASLYSITSSPNSEQFRDNGTEQNILETNM